MNETASTEIVVRGARAHNLKDVSVSFQKGKMTVLTGVSGSGKTSLAFDTIFAEGQRRYLECMPPSVRTFLEKFPHPPVDFVEGLSPAISIGRFRSAGGARSTLATLAGLQDPLRLLFAHLGTAHCPSCGREIRAVEPGTLAERLLAEPEGTKLTVLSPARRAHGPTRSGAECLLEAEKAGFVRVRVDGEILPIEDVSAERVATAREMEEVVDRLVVREGIRARLVDGVELAMKRAGGDIRILVRRPDEAEERVVDESSRLWCPACGVAFAKLEPSAFSFNAPAGACPACNGLGETENGATCEACGGRRFRPEVLSCTVGGLSIADALALSVAKLSDWVRLASEAAPPALRPVAEAALRGLEDRLSFLCEVGLGYLEAGRKADSLSSGELSRARLASALGQRLSGVLYVLDEPTAGLHTRDAARLVKTLLRLRDQGNTLLVVEHNPLVMKAADAIVELGPGAGREGGTVTFAGTPEALARSRTATTAPYLREARSRKVVHRVRPEPSLAGEVRVVGATLHNLKGVTASFGLGRFTVVTGVSGAGKSTLVEDVLGDNLEAWFSASRFARRDFVWKGCAAIEGAEALEKVVCVGKAVRAGSRRGNLLTATGCFDALCELFAATPLARQRGYGPGRFKFNVKGGRCEACRGEGVVRYEMRFLPDVETVCETCGGRRFNRETLDVHWAGRSIADVLALSVNEATPLFEAVPKLGRLFRVLREIGLGYLSLGQPLSTLSGGEAQRLLLASELARPFRGAVLYALDEPSTGQHPADLEQLLALLLRLRDAGHAVVAVDHNPILVGAADRVIELGPGGGEEGGRVLSGGEVPGTEGVR